MNEWKEYEGKTVDEALTEALIILGTTSDSIEYEIVEKETKGLLGMFGKPAVIRVRKKQGVEDIAKEFLEKVFEAMQINTDVIVSFNAEEETLTANLIGTDMGVLIGKRGQTLDSLQYLTSLVINKNHEGYLKVKLDTENYRERRKETLENLARNISHKVKRTHKPVALEPMNPYERRIIHSSLQNDRFVETHSEGEEPYRKVVITPKKGSGDYNGARGGYTRSGRPNGGNRDSRQGGRPSGGGRYGNNPSKCTKKEFVRKYGSNNNSNYSTDYMRDYAAYQEQKAAERAAESAEADQK